MDDLELLLVAAPLVVDVAEGVGFGAGFGVVLGGAAPPLPVVLHRVELPHLQLAFI